MQTERGESSFLVLHSVTCIAVYIKRKKWKGEKKKTSNNLLHFVCIKYRRQKMEAVKKWNKDFIALNQLDKKIHSKQNGKMVVIGRNLIRAELPPKPCSTNIN